MKVKIIKSFVDPDTGWFMEQGMTAEIKDESAKKYAEKGYVKIIVDKAKKAKK